MFFVLENDDCGRPERLILCDSLEMAKSLCAEIARQYKVPEKRIQIEILDNVRPGLLFDQDCDSTNCSGVWVIEEE